MRICIGVALGVTFGQVYGTYTGPGGGDTGYPPVNAGENFLIGTPPGEDEQDLLGMINLGGDEYYLVAELP